MEEKEIFSVMSGIRDGYPYLIIVGRRERNTSQSYLYIAYVPVHGDVMPIVVYQNDVGDPCLELVIVDYDTVDMLTLDGYSNVAQGVYEKDLEHCHLKRKFELHSVSY